MEDLLPQPKPKTGQVLYDRLKELSVQDDIVQIVPVGCLSACDRGNVIAMGARGKYTYQFGDLDETDPEQIDHVLQFVRQWVDSSDGFSKRSTRPKRMRSNALARVPPIQECQPTCAT
jgi:predicted metal-binding protein